MLPSTSACMEEPGAARPHRRGLQINAASLDNSAALRTFLHHSFVSLHTQMDGACSIHALLGQADATRVLTHPDPREWIRSTLHRAGCFNDIAVACRAAGHEQAWIDVISSIGSELLIPCLRGDVSEESACFVDCLRRLNPDLLTEAMAVMHVTEERKSARALAKANVLRLAMVFFSRGREANLVRPLATTLGLLPGDFHEPVVSQQRDGRSMVAGSNLSFPSDGPLTEFQAFLDRRSCFDGVR